MTTRRNFTMRMGWDVLGGYLPAVPSRWPWSSPRRYAGSFALSFVNPANGHTSSTITWLRRGLSEAKGRPLSKAQHCRRPLGI